MGASGNTGQKVPEIMPGPDQMPFEAPCMSVARLTQLAVHILSRVVVKAALLNWTTEKLLVADAEQLPTEKV